MTGQSDNGDLITGKGQNEPERVAGVLSPEQLLNCFIRRPRITKRYLHLMADTYDRPQLLQLIGNLCDVCLGKVFPPIVERHRYSGVELERLAQLEALATEVLGDPESAHNWLTERQFPLGWEKPIDAIPDETKWQFAMDTLTRIKYGVYC